VKNNDTLTLRLGNPDFLSVLYKGSDDTSETEYEIRLLNIDQERINIPPTNHSVVIEMPSVELKKIFLDQMIVNETVRIIVKQNIETVKFTSTGDFNNKCISTLNKRTGGFDDEINIKAGNNIDDLFSLKFLLMFMKASSLSTRVQICLESNFPIIVKYENEQNYIYYYLAPKVVEE
jgi:proliferating cell nuclear antigen